VGMIISAAAAAMQASPRIPRGRDGR